MLESKLYDTVKDKATSTKFYRVENKLNLGTPDMHLVNVSCSGWMEAKAVMVTAKRTGLVKIPFRPAQYAWLRSYYRKGGLSVLGMVTDLGFFFAVNESIQEEYDRSDFHRALAGLVSPLRYVAVEDLDDFFVQLRAPS